MDDVVEHNDSEVAQTGEVSTMATLQPFDNAMCVEGVGCTPVD